VITTQTHQIIELAVDRRLSVGRSHFGQRSFVLRYVIGLAISCGGCSAPPVERARLVASGWGHNGHLDFDAPSAMALFDSTITDRKWLQSFDSALALVKQGRELEPLVDAYGVPCRYKTMRYVIRTYASEQGDTVERGMYCTEALRLNGRMRSQGGPLARLMENTLESWYYPGRWGGFDRFETPLSASDLDTMPVGEREWRFGYLTAIISGPCYWVKQFDSAARKLGRWSTLTREAGAGLIVNDTNLLVRIASDLSRKGLRDWTWTDVRGLPQYVGRDADLGFASPELQDCLRWTPRGARPSANPAR
jgi:hypothetical protein